MATVLTTVIFAQEKAPATVTPTVKAEMKDLKNDIKERDQDEAKLAEDKRDGDKAGAKKMRKEIKEAKKDIRGDAKVLRKEGIKHPMEHNNHNHNHNMSKRHH